MIFNKELKERIKLLEYENELLMKRLMWIEDKVKTSHPPILHPRIIREDGWDTSYEVLREKYRDYTPKYEY
tara:strand:+ start:225 stop:437 length:213 start_codon:yes stop_codon:yes gene_type:complete